MTANIRSEASGTFGAIGFGSSDAITFDDTGILSGYKDSTITPAKLTQKLTQVTAITATGTAIDFTGIPSWVKRITVSFSGVSTNGTSQVVIRLGTSGGIEATGYAGQTAYVSNAAATGSAALSVAFSLSSANAATSVYDGVATICNHTGNTWAMHAMTGAANLQLSFCAGSKSLSGVLDRIRITTANGTDTFDAGTISLVYEG